MKPQLTIEAFADWVSKQPAEKEYNYVSCRACAFSQFLESVGFTGPLVDDTAWCADGVPNRPLPKGVNRAVILEPATFGALAARLRESL